MIGKTEIEIRDSLKRDLYTHFSEALAVLDSRRLDKDLLSKIEEFLGNDIPEILKKEKCGVMFRQIATPNRETRMFLSVTSNNNLKPVFFEYLEDKFTSNNTFKHSIAKLVINFGIGKKGGHINKHIPIIDFNKSNGKKLNEVRTKDGKSLHDFHKEMFKRYFDPGQIHFFDASGWYNAHGKDAINYYAHFLMLFVAHGILFENFLFQGREESFTKEVVLPALKNVENITGFKPLIVPLVPFDVEEDDFWYWLHHDVVDEDFK